jgi:ABC-type histidine transport system ATPase subunit
MSVPTTHPALELAGVRKNFGRTEIIRGIDLAIAGGERIELSPVIDYGDTLLRT